MEKTHDVESKRSRLMSIKPKAVSIEQESLVRKEPLRQGATRPLVVEPRTDEVDLVGWLRNNRPAVEADLLAHGAILFRGFKLDLRSEFEPFSRSVCTELFSENGEHPREHVGGKVYTPVFYPPDQHLLWHNENSFNYRWPTKIMFGCLTPAERGGETPVVDSRQVFGRLSPRVKERFLQKGVTYVRNYDRTLGLDWQTVFRTSDREAVERKCVSEGFTFEWKTDGRLKTRCTRPAAVRHPRTGESTWFNQAQHWHVSCLSPETRESVRSLFREEDFPRHCYYGDGSPIEDSTMTEILDAYRELEASFAWQPSDILLLDNLLTAHARNKFAGVRKLLVAMGDMMTYEEVERASAAHA